jgi:hypothetical protein
MTSISANEYTIAKHSDRQLHGSPYLHRRFDTCAQLSSGLVGPATSIARMSRDDDIFFPKDVLGVRFETLKGID